jgi:glycosyltransferase involved in cell wall biosynthesis
LYFPCQADTRNLSSPLIDSTYQLKNEAIMAPEISVIMPNWNGSLYIEQGINSVLTQTYRDFELIVVDDGSSDSSKSIIKRISDADGRVRLVEHVTNLGVSAALNSGINAARSDLLTVMGSDDLLSSDRLERLVDVARTTKSPSVIYSDGLKIDSRTTAVKSTHSKRDRPSGMILDYLLRCSHGDTSSAAGPPPLGPITAPKSCFKYVGYYDETLTYSEDLDMALRLAAKFPFTYDTMISYGHRWHSRSSYCRHGRKERYRQKARVIEKNLLENLQSQDSAAIRAGFESLLSFYLASDQYSKLLRYAVYSRDSIRAIPYLVKRVLRTRLAGLFS